MIPARVKEEEAKVFKNTLAKIVEAITPEKIISFGSRTDYYEYWSNFLPIGSSHHFTYHDLLIVTKSDDERREHEILEKISKYNKAPIRITAVVHSITAVNKAILEGSMFFVTMCHKGTVVYDTNNFPLAVPNKDLNELDLRLQTEKDWHQSFGLAQRFQKVAVNSAVDELHDIALLMLHQAVEHTCIAIIKYVTGYRPVTHNLNRLLWLMENFTFEGTAVFPQVTKEETELFNVLLRAYSDVRYKYDYKVSGNTVFTLIERVSLLMGVAEELYHKKRNSLLEHTPADDSISRFSKTKVL